MYNRSQTDFDLEVNFFREEKNIKRDFKNNYKIQQATLELFKKSIIHCDFNNFKESRIIWNLASYINIVSYDFKLIGENLFFNRDEWGKRFFARQSALLIYESIDDILKLAGSDFRRVISKFSKFEMLTSELNIIIKDINNYKKEHNASLKTIRHNCAAHRHLDCIEQVSIITGISWSESIEHLTAFDKILMKFGVFMQKVIDISLEESVELKKIDN